MTWHPNRRLLTVGEAAETVGRPASTIRRWVFEGRLKPTARQGHRWLYLEADVLRVDAETHSRNRRTVGGVRDDGAPATRERPRA